MRDPRNDRLGSDKAGTGAMRDEPQADGLADDEGARGETVDDDAVDIASAGARDHGRAKKSPERRCILTRRSAPQETLVRLALSPEGEVLPDVNARAPGRGAWIGVGRKELAVALESGKLSGALAHAFKGGSGGGGSGKTRLRASDDLPQRIEAALEGALLQRLGLEMRAGHLILGSDRIDRAARTGRIAALYHAADASADGQRKLDQAWRVGRDAEGSGQGGARLPLDRDALSMALGRENVVHLALADEGSALRIAFALRRLVNFVEPGSGIGLNSAIDDRAADGGLREIAAS